MNRKLLATLLTLVIAGGLYYGYHTYKVSADRELAERRAAAQDDDSMHQSDSSRRQPRHPYRVHLIPNGVC